MSNDAGGQKTELSAAKKALLEARLRQTVSRDADLIPRRNQTQAPLSFAQQRLWFLDQFSPGSYAYNVPRVFRVSGQLNVPALQHALDSLVERHEILRTAFKLAQGEPVQVVQPPRAVPLTICDLSALPEAECAAKAQETVISELTRPFNLSSDLMLRATLVRLSADEHIVVVMTHHIASDGWSKGVMFRELAAFYNAAVSNTPAALPELPIQYSDFAVWQRQWVKGVRLQKQAAYWKQQLQGAPPLLELPTDFPRPPVQGFEGDTECCFFPARLLSDLKALSQREGVTLFMTLFASFQVMLARYSGQDDIVVGTPIAGRVRAELEPLIGDFVNVLAMRTDLSGSPNFREVLQRTKKVALEAYDNQDLPFEMLVDELEHGRDLSRAPVFQTMFILETTPPPPPGMHGLRVEILDVEAPRAKNDLILFLAEDAAGLKVMVEYRTDLFNRATIQRFVGHYQTLLRSIVSDPGQPIMALAMCAPEEQKQIAAWNQTARETAGLCVHQLFEDQVARTPEAIALEFEGQKLTYRQLNARANQLAHYILDIGVKPESRVGICVHRSLEMVIGLLGIMKAGAAYVPIDPAYPRERIEFMLQDGGASVLVSESGLLEFISTHGAKVVCLDRDAELIAQSNPENPNAQVTPADLCYVIFTSGSTGKPKGVQVEHRNVANFLRSMQREPGIDENDVLAAVTTICFDIAGLEIYLPLLTGARLVIVSNEEASDGNKLRARMEQSGATVMQATPATWRLLLQAGWPGDKNLKVLCGGEAFPGDLAADLLPRCKSVWNMYGPTETTIWSALYRVTSGEATIPIGRPIDNTQIYVLDSLQQPTPIGVPGEIYIGGDGVARGYLNRPELTSERFLPDPFAGGDACMYRTGDLGRFRPDGVIQCLGRLDHQVKLRGFRIELGEIESVLTQFSGVHQAAADVKPGNSGDKRLVAYLVPENGADLSLANIRAFLKTKLPEYMVPAAFIILDRLPVSPNGKLNRGALPLPDDARPELAHTFVPPSTPVEQAVADIFSEVLEIRTVGLHDDFFELGGHSLLAARVVTRLRDRFQIEMTPRFLFESPTVKEVASRIGELLVKGADEDDMAAMLAELAELEER